MKERSISFLRNRLWLFLIGISAVLGLRASAQGTPPENMDFSVLVSNNPVEQFEVADGGFKAALATNWKVITLNTFPGMKWTTTFKDDCFSISPTKFSVKAPYCSYLVTPALDLSKMGGKALSFSMLATSSAGTSPLKVLLIDNQGATLRELLSVSEISSSNTSYFPKEVQMPSDLTGIGFIAFVAKGDKENRTQFKLNALKLAEASQEVQISCTPKEGLYFDTTPAGSVGATKEVEIFIKNFVGVPEVTLTGINASDFRLLNKNALTQTGGKLSVVFEPKSGGDKKADIQISAGTATFLVPLTGKATGAAATIKMTASPQSIAFGKVNVGSSKGPKSIAIEVQNALEAPTMTLKGANTGDFAVTGADQLTHQGGGLMVTFTPSSKGVKSATIELQVQGTLLNIHMTGEGTGEAPTPEPTDDIELLKDPYFYNFNTENQPTDWAFEGKVTKLERGYNSSTGFAVQLDAQGSEQGASIFQKVALKNDKITVKEGDMLEGTIHFRSMGEKVEGGAVRLACQWLNADGQPIASAEDAFINNRDFFDRHKAWDKVAFRTIAPAGATHFLFKVVTRAGSLVEMDDFGLLRLTRDNANMPFIAVLPHITIITGEKDKSVTSSILVQGMKLPYAQRPSFDAKNGSMSIAPETVPQGNSVGTYTVTMTPDKKGVYLNGYIIKFMGDDPVSTSAFNAYFIDANNPPKVSLSATTPLREMESFPTETDEQTLTFDITGVIDSPTVAILQDEAGIFRLSTSSFYYSVKQDKVLNSTVKVTFRPKEEKEYTAQLVITTALMEPFVLTIKGKGKKNSDGWLEKFTADKPLDPRFVGEAWKGYHLFDRGYYRLDGAWQEAGKVQIKAEGTLECDEWFANGLENITIAPISLASKVRLEYSIDGGGHWQKGEAFDRNGSSAIKTHRPTRFRLVNTTQEAIQIEQIRLTLGKPEERISFPKLNEKAMLVNADAMPLALLNETFNGTRHTRGIDLAGWQTLALQGDRPFWGWAQKNKSTMEVEEQCAQISFLNTLNPSDKREHQAWLISPALSYQKAASKILTFRLRYELPTENGEEKFGVFIIKEKEGAIDPQYLDITKLLLVENIENETWYDYYVDLSKVEGISVEDIFHIGFSFYSPVGGNATSLTFMVDDVTFGRTDMTEINVDKDLISFLFKVDQECTPQVFTVTTKNPKHPIALTMVPSRLAERFKLSTTKLPKEGGDVAVGFKSKDDKDRAAALLVQSRGSASKLVRLVAQFDNAIEVPDALNPTKVYPTITRETLFVEGFYSEYYIYSIEGACVAQGKASHRIDVAHLPEGNYIIRLLTEDGGMATHRFVRE